MGRLARPVRIAGRLKSEVDARVGAPPRPEERREAGGPLGVEGVEVGLDAVAVHDPREQPLVRALDLAVCHGRDCVTPGAAPNLEVGCGVGCPPAVVDHGPDGRAERLPGQRREVARGDDPGVEVDPRRGQLHPDPVKSPRRLADRPRALRPAARQLGGPDRAHPPIGEEVAHGRTLLRDVDLLACEQLLDAGLPEHRLADPLATPPALLALGGEHPVRRRVDVDGVEVKPVVRAGKAEVDHARPRHDLRMGNVLVVLAVCSRLLVDEDHRRPEGLGPVRRVPGEPVSHEGPPAGPAPRVERDQGIPACALVT